MPGPPESAGACSEDAGAGSPRHGRGSHTLAGEGVNAETHNPEGVSWPPFYR